MKDATPPDACFGSSPTTVMRHPDFAAQTAAALAESIRAAAARAPFVVVALPGGSTPAPVLRALAGMPLPWERVVFTFGDERAVPPDHENSNYRMAKSCLLDRAEAGGARVVRIEGELPPEQAAQNCESALRKLAAERGEAVLRHDVLMLGLGGDGHTASLFPGTAALEERERWVVANHVPKTASWRVTFTYPLINAAREVHFLVNDAKKETVIQQVLMGEGGHPAGGVCPSDGRVVWHLGHLAPG